MVAQHASLLQHVGMDVTILAEGPRPDWFPFTGRYLDRSRDSTTLPSQDLVIATFWTTLETAANVALGPVAHFCQGYEGRLGYLGADWGRIELAYATCLPTLAVTPDLGDYLAQRFGRACRVTPPPLDPLFRPRRRWWPRRNPWIAIPGVFEADVKDVATALGAVRRLQASGRRCRVLRFSSLPLTDRERDILVPDRYLCAVAPSDVADALGVCDLLLFPSLPEEGFGLPLLEAMASSVPAIASRIPSTVFMTQQTIPLVTPGDDSGFATAAAALLDDAPRWRRVRRDAYQAAQRFGPERVLPDLLAAVQWAANPDHSRRIT